MSPAKEKILALLAQHPLGIRRGDIASTIGASYSYTEDCLKELRRDGLCAPSTSSGSNVRWCLPEHLPTVRAHLEEERRERKRIADLAYDARRRMTKRITKQVRATRVISVFHLGAAA